MSDVVLVLLGTFAVYLISCFIWPYTTCPACSGGRHYSPSGDAFRLCGRCRGTGRKFRWGRRLFRGDPNP